MSWEPMSGLPTELDIALSYSCHQSVTITNRTAGHVAVDRPAGFHPTYGGGGGPAIKFAELNRFKDDTEMSIAKTGCLVVHQRRELRAGQAECADQADHKKSAR